jgi:trehalose 6-phosphate phosphatase
VEAAGGEPGQPRQQLLGDDLGDLPAFDALDRHVAAAPAHTALRVGVRSSEAPAELIERADLLVDGPDGALTTLRALPDGPAVDR